VCAGRTVKKYVPYMSASAVVIHNEEALYQVYAPLPDGKRDIVM